MGAAENVLEKAKAASVAASARVTPPRGGTSRAPLTRADLSLMAKDSEFNSVREIRNLANLSKTWSSSRVLNLSKIFINFRESEDYNKRPLFENSALNRAIILKHTLRLDERMLFPNNRHTVTKIILPYDPYDLRLGGRSFFYKQVHFEELMRSYLSITDTGKNRDAKVLKCIDELPSLDPFLLREQLHKNGFDPAGVYFQISPTDLQAMGQFTAAQIEQLVSAAFGPDFKGAANKLGKKILSDQLDKALAPLRLTLQMSEEEFYEGIMCWRGFLYYKWCHLQLQDGIREVLSGLSGYRPQMGYDENLKVYIKKTRPKLARAIVVAIADAGKTLEIYDHVYRALAVKRDPEPFRQFLLNGSELFSELGQKIGVLNHVVSFWKFRMTKAVSNTAKPLHSIEFADILMDFEAGLFNKLPTERPYSG